MGNNYRRLYFKYQVFLFPIGLILACVLIFATVIVSVSKQAISMFSDARVVMEEVDGLKKKLAILQQFDEAALERQLQQVTAAIPTDKSLPSILRTVEGISAQSQVTITNLTMMEPGSLSTGSAEKLNEQERRLGMYLLPFTVSVNGTFEQLRAFLQLSTQVRRFIRAKAFTMNFESGSDKGQLTTQVSFDAFYLPLPLVENPNLIASLLPQEQKTLSNVVGYPNMGEIILSQNAVQTQLTPRINPFIK